MQIRHIELKEANDFIERHHRHHKKVVGHRFSIGLYSAKGLCGVAIVGRPVCRCIDKTHIVEVTRLCTDGTPNACSQLYAACARAAKELGYDRIITYILESESGASLKASGWELKANVKGKTWNNNTRTRIDKHPTCDKTRWERGL